jgi:hypothetical protein
VLALHQEAAEVAAVAAMAAAERILAVERTLGAVPILAARIWAAHI